MSHKPDKWCLVDLGEGVVKVMACWSGGYLDGDSWKLNSGIESVEDGESAWRFIGHSGSVYECRKNGYGQTAYGAAVLHGSDLTPMDEDAAMRWIKDNLNTKET